MKAEILGCPTLDFCQRGHKVWLYSMGRIKSWVKPWKLIEWDEDVTEKGMHEDATGDKIWVNGKWSELWWPYWFCWSSHTHRGLKRM